MNLKSILKAVTPPVVLDAYRRLKNRGGPYVGGPMFDGVYRSFAEVPASGPGYEGDVWIESRTADTERLLETARKNELIPQDIDSRYQWLACVCSLLAAAQPRVKVLDFGGALGVAYAHLQRSLCDARGIEYHVVDNPRSCEVGRKLFAGDGRIAFHPTLDGSVAGPDVVFLSGVLQYIDDYRGVLSRLCGLKAKYFLNTFVSAGEIATFAAAQRNLRGSVMPVWFFNMRELNDLMAAQEYRLAFRGSSDLLKLEMLNFPETHRLSRMANLLYVRGERAAANR